ncbi:PREDICTED: rhodanese-like domain-containing protein 17 [Tarenaya hassleriana]|uniref:rhodanese-like domain-containing protein 17 n=1 Tax=Tarenaya hassleriana TaxID=28532 RepID=UPI00053C92C4|nr:PREDICTED: rhodanese-like domain-containing protein 17 [Tarenaya hassleriana]
MEISSFKGLFVLLFLHLLRVSSLSETRAVTIDVSQARNLLDSSDHVFLDVRTVEEYEEGHVAADKIFNVPYWFYTPEGREKNPNFLEHVSSLCNKTDHIVVGCKSGIRSLHATNDLLDAGFEVVRNMGGGFVEWVEKGFQIEAEQNDEL